MKTRATESIGRELAIILLFVMLTLSMTWPLARNMDRAVSNPGDPYINTFILAWAHHSLINEPARLFHAPIFYPHSHTLAFSENLLGIAIPTLPLSMAAMDPLTIYNVAMLLGFIFTGWGACVLGRMITGSLLAGIGAGIFFAFLPWRYVHLPHLQHQWAGWLPLLIAAIVWYWRSPSLARAVFVAGAFVANGLTNLHWFAFSLLAAPLVAAIAGFRSKHRGSWQAWAGNGAAFIVAGLALLPVLLPYRAARALYGMRSDGAEGATWSAQASDWIRAAPGTIYHRLWPAFSGEPERWLFPGILPVLLAGASVIVLLRRSRELRTIWLIGFALMVIGFVGSLGDHALLHSLLSDLSSVFRGIRAPARWAMIGYLGMAILISLTLQRIASYRRGGAGLAAVLIMLMTAELNRAPVRYWLGPAEPDAVTRRARELRENIVIAYLPLDQNWQYHRMLDAARHLAPMVNGVSGFAPPAYRRLESQYMAGELGSRFTDLLIELGATAVVISPDALNERAEAVRSWVADEIARGRLRPLAVFPSELHSGDFAFALSRSGIDPVEPVPEQVRAWLERRQPDPPGFVFGMVDTPSPGQSVHGKLEVLGWALAKEPITRIRLLIDNGGRAFEAVRQPHEAILRRFPEYAHEPLPAFSLSLAFDQRRHEQTDLEVEVTTVSGRVERFGYRWFDWRE